MIAELGRCGNKRALRVPARRMAKRALQLPVDEFGNSSVYGAGTGLVVRNEVRAGDVDERPFFRGKKLR